jgi:hypothetical protein
LPPRNPNETAIDLGVEADARHFEIGNHGRREDALADIDDHDPERECLALRT